MFTEPLLSTSYIYIENIILYSNCINKGYLEKIVFNCAWGIRVDFTKKVVIKYIKGSSRGFLLKFGHGIPELNEGKEKEHRKGKDSFQRLFKLLFGESTGKGMRQGSK